MRHVTFFIAAATLVTAMTSCKDEKKELATTTVNEYAAYVDSISNVAAKEAILNWDEIEATTDYKKQEAESAVAEVSDKTTFETKISATANKYNAF